MRHSSPFNIEDLNRCAQAYHASLEQEPGDTGTRLDFAWLLMAQSFYVAGREKLMAELNHAFDHADAAAGQHLRSVLDETKTHREGDALRLLRSCLQQISIVTQLSGSTQEKIEAEKLRNIVKQAHGEQEVLDAEKEAAQVLMTLMRSLISETSGYQDDPPPPLNNYILRCAI